MKYKIRFIIAFTSILFFTCCMFIMHKDQGTHHLIERGLNQSHELYIKELYQYATDDEDVEDSTIELTAVKEAYKSMAYDDNENELQSRFPYDKETKIKEIKEQKRKEKEQRLRF